MNCLFLDYTRADVSVREKFAFSTRVRAALYEAFRPLGGCVVLVTCNRTELYFCCDCLAAENILLSFGALSFWGRAIGEAAERRLFLLAAGLLSMLIGEDEILGQLRAAYREAQEAGATIGMDCVFQAALACGKRVRGETKISSLACSVATLAAARVLSFRPGKKRVLVIGATGKIGGSVLKNLTASADTELLATARTREGAARLLSVRSVPYAARYKYLDWADCVVCCTAAPHFVLRADEVSHALCTEKSRLWIDLAVPPDIDRAVAQISGCILVGIDDFCAEAEENNRRKTKEIQAAQQIAERGLAEYAAGEAARRYAAELAQEADRRAMYDLRKSDPAAFTAEVAARCAGRR